MAPRGCSPAKTISTPSDDVILRWRGLGECKLQDESQEFYIDGITAVDDSLLELADAPPISQLEPLSAGNTPTTQADNLVSTPDQDAYTDSAQTGFYNHDFDRSLRGSVIADFELASTRPLTSLPLLWCMSNTFTHFVKAHEGDVVCAVSLKRAVEVYLDNIGTSHDLVDKLNSRFDCKIMSKYENLDRCGEEDKWAARLSNEKRFRKDRASIRDVLEEAINDYFNYYGNCALPVALGARHSSDAVKVVVKATGTFVTVLDDARTSAYLKKYLERKDMIL